MKRARITSADYTVDDLRYRFIFSEAWEAAVEGARAENVEACDAA